MTARLPRRRLPILLQVGQTLFVIGLAVLVVGLLFPDARSALVVTVLLVAGVLLIVVGLRRRRASATPKS